MATYKPLQSVVLTSATSIVTFSGIDQGYTDLVLLISGQATSASSNVRMTFNGDSTSTLYSTTFLDGDGSSVTSSRSSSASFATGGYIPTSNYDICKIDINGYSNSSTNKTSLVRAAAPNRGLSSAIVNLWRNTAPITSISFEIYGSGAYRNWVAGSTFDLYGIKSGSQQALGGDVVITDGNYWYHAFRSTGAFTPLKTLSADILIVAGGGGGGADMSGGGGAGGLQGFTSQSLSATNYTVTVGAGGAGSPGSSQLGSNGENSQFGALTASVGGGRSGNYVSTTGASGGSGGGAGRGAGTTGGAGTSGQGFAGGNGSGVNYDGETGGGGGAGAVGGNGNGSGSGDGGIGSSNYSSWGSATSTGQNVSGTYYYAGGGGGGWQTSGTVTGSGGYGGGGAGAAAGVASIAGTANTGGGGGGGAGGGSAGRAGGSGIVIVRYPV